MSYEKNFAKRLKLARQATGLTVEQLAEILDMSPKTIWHLESGEKGTSISTLINLCNTLKVSPDYLLGTNLTYSVNEAEGLVDVISRLSTEEILLLQELIISYLKSKSKYQK